MFKKFSFIPALIGLSLQAQASSFLPPTVIGGIYYNDSQLSYPLLISSQDGGLSWAEAIDSSKPALPDNFQEGGFLSTSCSGINCIAAGFYKEKSKTDVSLPLLANSNSAAQSWTYAIGTASKLPSNFKSGHFYSANCSGLACQAVGYYTGQQDLAAYPLLASSTDGGQSWSFNIPSNQKRPGQFVGSSCSKSTCVAVGDSNGQLLAVFSKNQAANWSYAKKFKLPEDCKDNVFTQVDCTNSRCIAVGVSNTSTGSTPPLLMTTKRGKVWKLSSSFAEKSGRLTVISCSENSCVAGGNFDAGTDSIGFVYSTNGGKSWNLSEHSASFPADFNNGYLYSLSCKDLVCVAVGEYYTKENKQTPFIVQSSDGGVTWAYVIDSSTANLPAGAGIRSVKCSGVKCVASGFYVKNSYIMPLVATSQDSGKSWTFLTSELPLPADFKGSGVLAVGMS